MRLRCPCCGAENSLDALIAHDDARAAVMLVAKLGGELTMLILQYCGLFRPAKSTLSFTRLTVLLNELLSDIKSQRISRNGQLHEAPAEAWMYAIKTVLAARDAGTLKTPLRSHGYLYEVIVGYRPSNDSVGTVAVAKSVKTSQTLNGLAALEAMKNG